MDNLTLHGAQIKVYINGTVYGPAQSVNLVVDRGETEDYGIDLFY